MSDRTFSDLVGIVGQLRDPENGCPWDLEQTHESLAQYLEEESQEVLDVLQSDSGSLDFEELCEELGDVLLQVLLHAQLAGEEGHFTIEDVINVLSEKLIRRHPHVFGNSDASTVEEVMQQWETIKSKEKDDKRK